MTEKTTYQLPPEPDGPVWDRDGKRWTPTGIDGWWLRDVTGVQCTWARVLEGYGPLASVPAPAWPTAPHVWWDGEVWTLDSEGAYQGLGDYWEECHMRSGLSSDIRDTARRFAREAVPVVAVPAKEWEALRQCVKDEESVWDAAESLVDATEALSGETNE